MRSTICLVFMAVACSKVPETVLYGAPITETSRATLAEVAAHPDAFADKTVVVSGTVQRACSVKGCWMEIVESPNAPAARVTFKDYGFFVPTDAAGSAARVQGVVSVKAVDAGEVAHMESEGGKVAGKQPDGSAQELRIVATGVELTRRTVVID